MAGRGVAMGWAGPILLVTALCFAGAAAQVPTTHLAVIYLNRFSMADVSALVDPSFAYTHYLFAFWLRDKGGPVDAARVWVDNNLGNDSRIQEARSRGVKFMISCGGGTGRPQFQGGFRGGAVTDGAMYGREVAEFAMANNFDGVDFDIEGWAQANDGLGTQWLIDATLAAKTTFRNGIITHAPQAPYFSDRWSTNFFLVHQQVGSMIDFYNIQFYNQVTSEYDTYEELFEMATGGSNMTALRQIRDGTSFGFPGIPLDKIVLGKPVTSNGVVNTGFVEMTQLSRFLVQAKAKEILPRGFMGWQWFLDIEELDSQWSHVMGSAWTGFPIPPPLPERQGPEIIMLPPPPVGSGQCAGSYTVQSGDSLSKIGRLYGLTFEEVFAANTDILPDPDTVQVGQVLKIPPCDPGVDGGTPEPPAAPTTPGLPSSDDNNDDEEEEDFDDGDDDVNNAAPIVLVPPPAGSGECAALYEVAPGDTLFAIGQMFGLPYQELFAANTDILPDENTIEVGQVLKIPPCDPGVVSP